MIKLPKQHDGKPMVSWSQIELFNDKKGFNTGRPGWQEYVRKYFAEEKYPDKGWGQFGTEVEEYICERKHEDKFTAEERKVLDSIKPLGIFQQQAVIDFDEFCVLGYLDDMSGILEGYRIRDYKTKSESSKKDLKNKKQLHVYSLWVRQETGSIPSLAEYCIIERLGGRECMLGGGRESLSVGERIWYEEVEITEESLAETEKLIRDTVDKISDLYKTYVKLEKL